MRREGGESEEDQEDIAVEGKGRKLVGTMRRKGGGNEERERLITHITPTPTQSKTKRLPDHKAHERHKTNDTRQGHSSRPRHRSTHGRYKGTHRHTGTQELR